MGLSILIGLAVMPRAMDWLRRNYSKETVLIISLAFCFMLAFISGYVGLSVAIGAFLAGIIVSESSCNNIVRRRIEPMKEVFIAIFFFAIGMRIDIGMVLDNILLCVTIAIVFIIGKLTSIFFASYLTTMSFRSASTGVQHGGHGRVRFHNRHLALTEASWTFHVFHGHRCCSYTMVAPLFSRQDRGLDLAQGTHQVSLAASYRGWSGCAVVRRKMATPQSYAWRSAASSSWFSWTWFSS